MVLATISYALIVHTATLLASVSDSAVLWGLNSWHDLPLWASLGLYLLPALSVLVGEFTHSRLSGATVESSAIQSSIIKAIPFALLAVIVPLFWFARDATHLMGDGLVILASTERGAMQSDHAMLANAVMLRVASLFRNHVVPSDGDTIAGHADAAVAVFSVVCGALFVCLSWLVSGELWNRPGYRMLGTLLFLLHPTLLLFFGYAEFYAFAWVAALLVIWLTLLARRGRVPCWACLAAWVVAVGAHFLLFLFFPLIASAFLRRRRALSRLALDAIIGLCAGLAVLTAAGVTPEGFVNSISRVVGQRHFLGLSVRDPSTEAYGLFDFWHCVDAANEAILVMPLIILIPLWAWGRSPRGEASLLGIIGLLTLIASVCINPRLGYARDWDLMAFPALPLNLLGIHLLVALSDEDRVTPRALRRVVWFLLGVGMARTVGWVELHHNPERLLPRARIMASESRLNAPFPRRYLSADLATYFERRGDLGAAFEQAKRTVAIDPHHPKMHLYLAHLAHRMDDDESEFQALRRAVDLDSSLIVAWVELGRAYLDRGELESAEECFERVLLAAPENIKVRVGKAIVQSRLGNSRGIIAEAQMIAGLSDDPDRWQALRFLAGVLERDGRSEDAIKIRQLTEPMSPQ